ncbi:hypothetical protein CE91St44_22950 [Oscillospiraceae bacterium]|nr:hypothetical protein CE91St44_22950 [Oscillospiraceae bacterium]
MRTQDPDLLETLAAAAGCDYLSDLRLPTHRAALRLAVQGCAAEDYPARQWQEALGYLCGASPSSLPADQAREKLLGFLGGKPARR